MNKYFNQWSIKEIFNLIIPLNGLTVDYTFFY